MISDLIAKFKAWKHQRMLRKEGFKTQAQYDRYYDPDYNIRATRVKDYFHGYSHLHCFENRTHQIYWWDMAYDGSREIVEWCEEHCQGKFRFDALRVIKDYWGEWTVNEIGGGDYYFVGFKDELDAFNFKLRWA